MDLGKQLIQPVCANLCPESAVSLVYPVGLSSFPYRDRIPRLTSSR